MQKLGTLCYNWLPIAILLRVWGTCGQIDPTHKILGPKNVSKSCQVVKFWTSQTRHHAGDEKDKLLTTQKITWSKICQKFVKKSSIWQGFEVKNVSMHFYAFWPFWEVSKLVKNWSNDKKNLDKLEFVRLSDPNQSYWLFFDHLDDPRDFVCRLKIVWRLIKSLQWISIAVSNESGYIRAVIFGKAVWSMTELGKSMSLSWTKYNFTQNKWVFHDTGPSHLY